MTHQEEAEDGFKPFETWRVWKNVAVVSVAFMIQFVAGYGMVNLQSSINAEAGLGTVSMATGFAGSIIAGIFLSVMITKWLGTKLTICLCLILQIPYVVCQMFPTFYSLIPSTFVVGFADGPLWCAMCTYLAMLAETHAAVFKLPSGVLLQRFLGLFYTIFQTCQIWGNLISSLVLSSGNNTAAVTSVNVTMIPQLCGANFLANSDAQVALPKQPPEKLYMIAGIFLACIAVATLLVAVGLDSMKRYESCSTSISNKRSGLGLLVMTLKLLAIPDQFLLLFISIFIGIQSAFFYADFNASFVSCAVGTGSVGYIMIAYGVSGAVGCFITGCLVKWIGRIPLFLGAFLIDGGVFITLLVWRPHAGDYYIMFIIAVLWALCESVWMVQINAYYGVLFRGDEEVAFSSFRLWQNCGQIISHVLSSYVRTRYKVYILLCSMIVGVIGYLAVEYRQYRNKKKEEEIK